MVTHFLQVCCKILDTRIEKFFFLQGRNIRVTICACFKIIIFASTLFYLTDATFHDQGFAFFGQFHQHSHTHSPSNSPINSSLIWTGRLQCPRLPNVSLFFPFSSESCGLRCLEVPKLLESTLCVFLCGGSSYSQVPSSSLSEGADT